MKKSVNKNKKKINLFTKRNVVIGVILLLVLLPVGFYYYNQMLDYYDEKRFMTMKADMENLAAKLAEARPDDGWAEEAWCDEGSVKFQEAVIRCGVSLKAGVAMTDSAEVVSTMDAVNNIVLANGYTKVAEMKYPNLLNGLSVSSKDLTSNASESPYGSTSYKSTQTNEQCYLIASIEAEKDENFKVHIGCEDKARKKYF